MVWPIWARILVIDHDKRVSTNGPDRTLPNRAMTAVLPPPHQRAFGRTRPDTWPPLQTAVCDNTRVDARAFCGQSREAPSPVVEFLPNMGDRIGGAAVHHHRAKFGKPPRLDRACARHLGDLATTHPISRKSRPRRALHATPIVNPDGGSVANFARRTSLRHQFTPVP